MWLAPEQYNRGILSWNTNSVDLASVTLAGKRIELRPFKIDGSGFAWCLFPFNAQDGMEFQYQTKEEIPTDSLIARLEWVRNDGNIETQLWLISENGLDTARLLHIHGFGRGYRIVVDASRLQWDHDRIFRVNEDSIRFLNGPISGHRAGQHVYEQKKGEMSAIRSFGPTTLNGRWLEVIASDRHEVDAETRCRSLLGFLSLVFGPNSLGEVVFESLIDIPSHGSYQATLVIHIGWTYDLHLPEQAFRVGLSTLPEVASSSNKGATRALERYSQGIAASSDELKLAAFFAGIEVIARDFEEKRGGVPWIKNRAAKHRPQFRGFLKKIGDEKLKEKIMGSLGHVPISDSFDFWCTENRLNSEESARFREIANRRNSLFHEGQPGELHDLVDIAKRLLQQMLQIELGIPANVVWNNYPTFQITAPITFPNYGRGKTGDPEEL